MINLIHSYLAEPRQTLAQTRATLEKIESALNIAKAQGLANPNSAGITAGPGAAGAAITEGSDRAALYRQMANLPEEKRSEFYAQHLAPKIKRAAGVFIP